MRIFQGLAAMAAILMAMGPAAAEVLTPDAEAQQVAAALKPDLSNCDDYRDRLNGLVSRSDFEGATVLTRRWALFMFLSCDPRDDETRLAVARQLAPIAERPAEIYAARLPLVRAARSDKDVQGYLKNFNAIADADPALLENWNPLAFDWALVELRDDPAAKLALLSRLRSIPWRDEIGQDGVRNGWAYQAAVLLADAGDLTPARTMIEQSDATWVMMSVAQDRRFAPLWPALEATGRFDWARATEIELDQARRRTRQHPHGLEAIVLEIDLLRALGRQTEAVALGERYARRLESGESFDDGRLQRHWLLNTYAYALFDVGRFEEADRVMALAQGSDGVSQRVNRAELLNNAGRPAEALGALEQIDPNKASPAGLMWRDAQRACALAQSGETAAVTALLEAMRPRWRDNPAALTTALICADALEEAGALYVRRLETPATRGGALEAFRSGRPPDNLPPVAVTFEARRARVLAQPKVQAALAGWGRGLTTPLIRTYWGAL